MPKKRWRLPEIPAPFAKIAESDDTGVDREVGFQDGPPLLVELLVGNYARRWRVENSSAEAVSFFSLNAAG